MGSLNLEPAYELKCSCNQYPWGKQGSDSISARLCAKQPGWDGKGPQTAFKIDENKSYAEMWMGTYPVLPSYVADTGEDLQDLIGRNPEELVGKNVMKKFGHSKLPYLPKVLSISKALPLQLHPNIDVATKLHEERPEAFTDPNHKPEIAIALGKFEAFCGFRPLNAIEEVLNLEPLKQFNASGGGSFDNEKLKTVVRTMLEASDETVREVYKALVAISPDHYKKLKDASHIPQLAGRLADQYTNADPGILVALVTMNFLVLQAGESIYIPADGIHAYLSGDIIECMARSNNVLNTGFCPRAERNNAELFCSCLTFTPHSKEECMLPPKPFGKSKSRKTRMYAPPLSEFSMLETKLGQGESELLGAVAGPSIVLATQGSADMKANGKSYRLNEGGVFFVPQGVELRLDAGSEGLLMHTTICE